MIAQKIGRTLTPWQQDVIDVALERVDGPGSAWAYDQVVTIVGRRSGKTVTSLGVSLIRALAGTVNLANGRVMPFRAAHTAQNLTAARKRFMEDLVEPYKDRMNAETWGKAHRVFRNLANSSLTIDPDGVNSFSKNASEIQVYAPTANSVRGDGLLHLTFDEALAFTLDEGAALMSASRPAMAEYGGHAQQWVTTNISAETDDSRWITGIRDMGRAAVAADRRTGIAYTEFSMPSDGDPADEALWWAHLPGLADGIIGIDHLRRDIEILGPGSFGAEYLGLWPGLSAVRAWGAIPATVWDAAAAPRDENSTERPVLAFAVDIDPFGRSATIAAATSTPEGGTVVEVIAHAPGSAWVVEALTERVAVAPDAPVVIDDYGPGHDLLLTLDREAAMPLHPLTTRDAAAACYAFDQGIGAGTIKQWPNPDLRDAVSAAARTTGRSWVYERRLDVPQTPLLACVLAAWGAAHHGAAEPIEPAIF